MVKSGAYRRQPQAVTEVDNFEGVLPGSIVALNLAGNTSLLILPLRPFSMCSG